MNMPLVCLGIALVSEVGAPDAKLEKELLRVPKVYAMRWRQDSKAFGLIVKANTELRVFTVTGTKICQREDALPLMFSMEFLGQDLICSSKSIDDMTYGISELDCLDNKSNDFKVFGNPISFIRATAEKRFLGLGGAEGEFGIWDRRQTSMLWSQNNKNAEVLDVHFNRTSTMVGVTRGWYVVSVYDLKTGALLKSLKSGKGRILASRFLPDDGYILCDSSGEVRRFSGKTREMTMKQVLSPEATFQCASFSEDNKYIAAATENSGAISLYSLATSKMVMTLVVTRDLSIDKVLFSPDSKKLLISAFDQRLTGFDDKSTKVFLWEMPP